MADNKIVSKEIPLPEGVTAALTDKTIFLKKAGNEVSRKLGINMDYVKIEGSKITLSAKKSTKTAKKNIGSEAAHIKNMIKGVSEGHKYVLKICSGHFPMNVSVLGTKLAIKNFLGEKIPRELNILAGVDVKVEGDNIIVKSNSKDAAGQVSAGIEQLTRRPGFDTRVFQDGIYITEKDGKKIE